MINSEVLHLIVVMSSDECIQWVKGIQFVVKEAFNSSYPIKVTTWLKREFHLMENGCA